MQASDSAARERQQRAPCARESGALAAEQSGRLFLLHAQVLRSQGRSEERVADAMCECYSREKAPERHATHLMASGQAELARCVAIRSKEEL